MQSKCKKCNYVNEEEALFCAECGEKTMKSLYFLNDYFQAYVPYDSYLFSVFFISFEELNISTREELEKCIQNIRDNVNNKDCKLISKYAVSRGRIGIIARLTLAFSKISENLVHSEINGMYEYGTYVRNEVKQNKNYDYFKFHFPRVDFLDYSLPYKVMKPNVYYFMREQLVKCSNKNEILNKLSNPEFKFFIVNWFYELSDVMKNKRKNYVLVEKVCSEIEFMFNYPHKEELYLDSIRDTKKEISKIFEMNTLSFIKNKQ